MLYQFQVRAANMAGVGIPSLPSETFKCEEWTIAVPGRHKLIRKINIIFYFPELLILLTINDHCDKKVHLSKRDKKSTLK